MLRILWLALALTGCAQKTIRPANGEMSRLLREADTDGDKKITVHDRPVEFTLRCHCGRELKVTGAYPLSNLLQELAAGAKEIDPDRLYENPVSRISRNIREKYWVNLVRQVTPSTLAQVSADPKLPSQRTYLYIPDRDILAKQIFKETSFRPLPDQVGAEYFRSIAGQHGLLYLPKPYVVPGGRFNEMYGWDSYFESLGLIQDGRADLAQDMAENFIYEIEHYGKILNGNRTYYLNRSQPPFFTSLIMALRPHASEEWIARATKAAIKEYDQVWTTGDRMTKIGLSRYYGSDFGIPPEVEPGHFDWFLKRKPSPARLKDFLAHDRAVRESGHDTTYRWRDQAADFVTVDLNSLLYKYETDLAELTGDKAWLTKAAKRKDLMMKYLWDDERKIFFDFNFRDGKRSSFVSATAFYPLWAKIPTLAQARATTRVLLAKLEAPGGLLSNDHRETPARQWDYPSGWAPHQMLAWQGLKNYGETADQQRLIYKWLYMITKNAADFNGTIPEKFDVVKRSHAVFAEYGNVGTDFSYITEEGFGWMNASYQVGLAALDPHLRKQLENLVPSEELK